MYKSFTVLAVIATHAAAQQCVWPPVEITVPDIPVDVPVPDPVDDFVVPFDITEHLCKAENYKSYESRDWWNIDALIQSYESQIQSIRD